MKLIVSLVSLLFSFPIFADSGQVTVSVITDIVKKESPYSVNETMDKLEAIIRKKGMSVLIRIDHKKSAQRVGIDMNDAQVLIFGNPKIATKVLKKDVRVSLDLPLRVAAYKEEGKVYIAYHKPTGFSREYKKLEGNKVLIKVTVMLDEFTSSAVK